MKKFTVTLRETVVYTVEIEADDEDEASDIACYTWAESADPTNDFCGDGQGVEVIEVASDDDADNA